MGRLFNAFSAVLALSLASAAPAEGQTTYDITVQLDEATAADDDIFTAAAMAAPAGEIARSLRKLSAGLLLEVRLLIEQRVHDGLLTLDNGLQVALVEGDRIRAKKVTKCSGDGCEQKSNGAVLTPFPPNPGSGTPTYVDIYKDGVCARTIIFQAEGPPSMQVPGCLF